MIRAVPSDRAGRAAPLRPLSRPERTLRRSRLAFVGSIELTQPAAGLARLPALPRLAIRPARKPAALSIWTITWRLWLRAVSGDDRSAWLTCFARGVVRHVTHRPMKAACRRSGAEGGQSRDFIRQAGAFVTCLQIPEQRIRRGNNP
jgi:hypothetical protein